MSCGNLDILKLIDYYENGTDLSSYQFSNYNFYDLWNAAENAAAPPNRVVCSTLSIPDILSVTKAILGEFTTASEYLGTNLDFYYLYLKAIGSPDATPTFTNSCVYELYQVFTVNSYDYLLSGNGDAAVAWSIRALNPDYTGACIRIRKSSDNAEDDFYFDSNNELSLSSANIGGTSLATWIGSDNGFVKIFYDQSGNSRNAIQNTTSSQPQIVNAGSLITKNGKASLTPISGQNLTATFALGATYTTFQVDTRGNDTANYYIPNRGTNNSRYYWYNVFGASGTALSSNSGTPTYFVNGVQFTGTTQGQAWTFDTGLQRILTATNLDLSTWTGYQFQYGVGDNTMESFQERVLFATDRSADRVIIEANINTFYSIY